MPPSVEAPRASGLERGSALLCCAVLALTSKCDGNRARTTICVILCMTSLMILSLEGGVGGDEPTAAEEDDSDAADP